MIVACLLLQGYWALLLTHFQTKRESVQAHMHHELLAIEHGYTSKLQVESVRMKLTAECHTMYHCTCRVLNLLHVLCFIVDRIFESGGSNKCWMNSAEKCNDSWTQAPIMGRKRELEGPTGIRGREAGGERGSLWQRMVPRAPGATATNSFHRVAHDTRREEEGVCSL